DTKKPETGFMGLQRWIFGQKKWETIKLESPVTYNLVNHGAAFLSSTASIIVFAGSKYPNIDTPSADTYVIDTVTRSVVALPGQTSLLAPLVLQWGTDGALIIGGDADNTNLLSYSPSSSFSTLKAKLKSGIPRNGQAGASLIDGDDGSRMLITYDLTTSPATVNEQMVLGAGGQLLKRASGANPASSTDSELTVDNWPTYNKTGAVTGTISGAAVASEGDMVVISGVNDKEPLALFNARKNSWENADDVLDADPKLNQKIKKLSVSSSTSSSAKPSATKSSIETSSISSTVPTASASATGDATVGTTSSGSNTHGDLTTVQLLFVVLGSILGAAILLACIFFFLKKRRERRTVLLAKGERRERLSFQDRGASFMKEAGGSVSPHTATFARPFAHNPNTDSWSQVQQTANRVNGLNGGAAPINTYSSLGNYNDGPTVQAIGGQGVLMTPTMNGPHPAAAERGMAAPVFGKERSSGWSKYFSGTSATNLVGAGMQPNTNYPSTGHSSTYTDASPYGTQKGFQSLHHPNPYLHNAGPGIVAGGMVGGGTAFNRPASNGPEHLGQDRRGSDISMSSIGADSFSSGIPESINTEKPVWSPVGHDREAERFRGPVASSVYPDSPSLVTRDDRRDTEYSRYSGPPTGGRSHSDGVDNLSWLNLRAN
ncbi:hypothetical protein EDC01DRAFT_668174, partial [Geopyxis carbonaria]